MGKSKPRYRNKNRADPKAKPIKPPTDPELASIRETRILPVLKYVLFSWTTNATYVNTSDRDLQSPELKKRSAAAVAIANIIEDTKCRKLLLREQIVKILLEQTLTDASLESRSAGWGILNNLAQEEENDFCIHLYRQDILTAIGGIIKSVSLASLPRRYIISLLLTGLDLFECQLYWYNKPIYSSPSHEGLFLHRRGRNNFDIWPNLRVMC